MLTCPSPAGRGYGDDFCSAVMRCRIACEERTGYFIMPLSSKNATGSLSLPCSHIKEKNQIPLSPIQKSAGVKVILESIGFSLLSGVYSACQPKISPCQYLPRE